MNQPGGILQLGVDSRNGRQFADPALCVVMALVVFAAYAVQIFNLFYFTGANSHDAGWFAYLMSRFDLLASNPLYIRDRGIPSFYAYHLSPFMPFWGGLSQLAGLSPPASFAFFQSFIHALLALCGAALASTQLSRPWNLAFRLFVGLSLAFSPIALNAISFPHHELAISIFFIATCYAIWRKSMALAVVLFILLLSVRTDSGFHACCFFGAFAAAEWLKSRRLSLPVRRAVMFAVVGFVYSVAAFLIVRYLFPNYDNLRSSYLGPVGYFNHLNFSFFIERIWILLQKRPELFLLLAFVVGLGVKKHDLTIAAGAIAILPWTILHLSAYRSIPGELYTYYAFPYLILMAWPFLVPALRTDEFRNPALVNKEFAISWVIMIAALLVVYFTTPFASDRTTASGRIASAANFIPKLSGKEIAAVNTFANAYPKVFHLPIDIVLMDEGMLSLLPNTSRSNLFSEGAAVIPAENKSFVIAYFGTYMHAPLIEKQYAGLATECFRVKGTNIRLLAREQGDTVRSAFSDQLTLFDCKDIRPSG